MPEREAVAALGREAVQGDAVLGGGIDGHAVEAQAGHVLARGSVVLHTDVRPLEGCRGSNR